jgi:DNA repair exonuclease SbcCD ATPase subunit
MSLHTQGISVPARTVLGRRKDGRPILPIAGGAPQPGEGGDPVIVVPAAVVEPPAPQATAEPRFTAEDIQKARQEEKDKLYKRLQNVEDQNKQFLTEIEEQRKAREAAQAEEERKRQEAQDAAKAKAQEDLSAKELLAVKEQEWNQRLQQFETEREQERLLFAKEQEFNNLQTHIQRRVAEESENIAPELLDFVGGNTPEEVEASIATVKAKTQAILESVQQAAVQQRASMRGVSPTGYSTTGPMDTDPGHKSYSLTDLRDMPMSEYAKIRGQLGVGQAAQNQRGLYS